MATQPDTTKAQKYEAKASRWLADGNDFDERGDKVKAQKC